MSNSWFYPRPTKIFCLGIFGGIFLTLSACGKKDDKAEVKSANGECQAEIKEASVDGSYRGTRNGCGTSSVISVTNQDGGKRGQFSQKNDETGEVFSDDLWQDDNFDMEAEATEDGAVSARVCPAGYEGPTTRDKTDQRSWGWIPDADDPSKGTSCVIF